MIPEVMNDTTPMPWGVHKGKPIGEVPFDYLFKFYKKMWLDGPVLRYFENQLRVLQHTENEIAPLEHRKPKQYLVEEYKPSYPYKKSTN